MAEPRRLLVVSPPAVDGSALREEVERRAGEQRAEVLLVAPAVIESRIKHALGDVDDSVDDARERLERSVQGLRSERIAASGTVGDADPLVATEDALGTFPADEVLIVTRDGERAEWFEEDLFERATERFEPPVIHVELRGENGGGLAEVERSGPGVPRDEPESGEVELSPNLPPFSARDILGIVVAIVGTIVLAILAANVADHHGSSTAAARTLIAIGFALINLAHVVGLVFFNSQRYRGPGREIFGNISLFGTPIAILVSLLIG
jgi:hypothetical protein